MKVEILGEAQQNLAAGYRFYESQAACLGDYFLDSLFSDVDSLQFCAGIHATYSGYYRLLSKRFPFADYHIENGSVRVYAVLDCRRDPSWIRERLT